MARPTRRFTVEIEGLADFQKDLGRADKVAKRRFNKVMRSAGDPIIDEARRLYYSGGHGLHPVGWGRRTGRSLRGIRTTTHFGGFALELGGSRFPYLLGQEWGSKEYPQFGPPRGGNFTARGNAGTFFWPAWEGGREQVEARVLAVLDEAVAILAGRSRGAARLAGHLEALS